MRVQGIDLEIVEELGQESVGDVDFVVPNDVLINGVSVPGPKGSAVAIETSNGDDMVRATLTMYCRSVKITAQPRVVDDTLPPIYAQLIADTADREDTRFLTSAGWVRA